MPIETNYPQNGLLDPDPITPLWKFMDIPKFLALLTTRSLHLATLSSQEDQMEGCLPPHYYKQTYEGLIQSGHTHIQASLHFGILNQSTSLRNQIAISCFHQNEVEPISFWKLYAKAENGICFKTSVNRIKSILHQSEDRFFLFKVDYYNPKAPVIRGDLAHIYTPASLKRDTFKNEQEVRLLYGSLGKDIKCKTVKVPLRELIEEIIISPYAEEYAFKALRDTVNMFDLGVPIRHSSLLPEIKPFMVKKDFSQNVLNEAETTGKKVKIYLRNPVFSYPGDWENDLWYAEGTIIAPKPYYNPKLNSPVGGRLRNLYCLQNEDGKTFEFIEQEVIDIKILST